MKKKRQDIIFACLTNSERKEYKDKYATKAKSINYDNGFNDALESVFGIHNLTSDTEPAELLFVERDKVIDLYATMDKAFPREAAYSVQKALESLFGDKCLPDKPSVQVEPYTEPETKVPDNRQALYYALGELESASAKVRKALISLQ